MKKNRQILVLAALLFSFLCFPADKVLAASNVVEVPLTVKQNFEENSNEKGIDLTGTYEFRALDIGIPMPGDSDNDRHVFVLDGNNAEKMISLQFQHGGVYRYHLVQTSKDRSGCILRSQKTMCCGNIERKLKSKKRLQPCIRMERAAVFSNFKY